MKRVICCVCSLVLLSFLSIAQSPQSVFDQLVSINKEWKNQPDINPALKEYRALTNLTEVELIQSHLSQTEKLLRSRSAAHLNAEQKKTRAALLDILHDYWMKGVFPKNTFHKERRPYFIDIFNNYCAVGYLMSRSGADAMARDINRTHNFSYLKDIQHPDLHEWQQRSGFSIDELALIQPAYACYPTSIIEMHYNNAGPDVNEFIEVTLGSSQYSYPSRIEFYDNLGNLYKTVQSSSYQFYCTNYGPNAGAVGCSGLGYSLEVVYYRFPVNESFPDEGSIKLINRTNGIDNTIALYVYNAGGIDATYYSVWPPLGLPIGSTIHYNLIENGTTTPGISLNFCSPYCSPGEVNYYADLLPASLGTSNVNCFRILPLTLSKFDYSIINDKVQLSWQTPSETNTDRFEIERSGDGISFSKIGSVNAAMNSAITKYYDFLDASPASTNYYRLRQVDRDGKSVYSKILLVKLKVNSPLVLYTPTVTTILRLGINLNQQDIQKVQLYDLSGRGTGTGFAFRAGLNEIDVSRLTPGIYFLRLETRKGERFSERFIKQ